MVEEAEKQDVHFLDIDEICPPERRIRINKKDYRIRGDISTEETIKFARATAKRPKDDRSPEALDELLEQIQSFFIDKIDKKELLTLSVNVQLPKLIAFLYKSKDNNNGKKKDTE